MAQNLPLSGLSPAASSAAVTKVSCAAVGSCVAVGSYGAVGGTRQGLIETLSDGHFSPTTAPVAGLSPAAAGNPQVFLFDVRCPVVGWCVADGQYVDGSGHTDLLAETLSNGSWSATTLPDPAGTSNPDLGIESMSCPVEGSCVLVGAYASSGQNQPLAERLASGTWTAQAPPINTLSPAGTEGQLFDVSCSSSTACAAVGDTDGGAGDLVETSSGGSWVASTPSLAGLTPTAAHGAAGALTNVSCPSSGSCSEAGTYEDQTFATQGLVVAGTSATARQSQHPQTCRGKQSAVQLRRACLLRHLHRHGQLHLSAGPVLGATDNGYDVQRAWCLDDDRLAVGTEPCPVVTRRTRIQPGVVR